MSKREHLSSQGTDQPLSFSLLGEQLLTYKNGAITERNKILLNIISAIRNLSPDGAPNKELIKKYKTLCEAATLINYADALRRMEHQEYFDILIDFARMPMSGEFTELNNYFEFHPITPQMRLKCSIKEIPLRIWQLFREAQEAYLQANGKTHLFHLRELNINTPPKNQLYPIQIQMGAKLHNEAVDRISVDSQGRYRFVKRFGFYLLPGGGMVEPSNKKQTDALLLKMLEEHLEEEHANLYIKATALYDAIDQELFNKILLDLLTNRTAPSFCKQLIPQLKILSIDETNNSTRLKTIITRIDREIRAAKKDAISNQNHLKTLIELRATIQVRTFKCTSLFAEALEYIKRNTKCVDIQQYLDTRVLGGFQMSHSFIMTGQPLEDWFKNKFNGLEGQFGDDITGSTTKHLTLLQAITRFRTIKFCHLLIALACQIECINNGTLNEQTLWSPEQFKKACQEIVEEITKLLILLQSSIA
ncbi:hypothetical protein [Legionella fallonii]|uniref:Uncharacterized protein n=1 Tax=Legionella fallonii LLAP-10 TaxID=1212491 RepID=A0A098G6Q3_9GAMM|nr:hypothetical protein [Legionella fallonii]CEG57165.1 conserved protein of unknown function [Legionella fallonii LLAP-10]